MFENCSLTMTLVYSLSVCGNMRKRKRKRRRLSWNKKPHGSALRRLRQRKRQAVQQFSSLDPDPCPVNLKPCSKISMFGRVFSNRWISQISRCSWNIVQDWVVYTRYIKVGKLTNDMIWEASWVRHSGVILLIPESWLLSAYAKIWVDCCIIKPWQELDMI